MKTKGYAIVALNFYCRNIYVALNEKLVKVKFVIELKSLPSLDIINYF